MARILRNQVFRDCDARTSSLRDWVPQGQQSGRSRRVRQQRFRRTRRVRDTKDEIRVCVLGWQVQEDKQGSVVCEFCVEDLGRRREGEGACGVRVDGSGVRGRGRDAVDVQS
jgi:hypothetical protein